ncbi:beta-1,3-galactosyltransferase 5-like [Hydractinia symbiolongicarpus]|uniref:beta-1,3-galactosyltransferase 5-like n=1 Tax=Hydractinia symbiolongicarpus TaxID=13093 RepID=UPI00254EB932|nr:beta-1,3-galactosyltransferase 5-like [Hydractinia symbiolongicarpus]
MTKSRIKINYKVVILLTLCCIFFIFLGSEIYFNKFVIELDYSRIYVKANLSNLNQDIHVTKLLSKFSCSKKPIKLLVVVISNVMYFQRRDTIRKTWGKRLDLHTTNDFRTFFAVAKTTDETTQEKLENEIATYGDVIQGDFYEDYYKLPRKTELVFEWAYKHCEFDYLLKADDDVYVNLMILFQFLDHPDTPKTKLYAGRQHVKTNVFREGKLKVTFEEYGTKNYPDFCSGGSAILSRDVVGSIIPYFQKNPFRLEDVYTGMLMMNAGVVSRHVPSVRMFEKNCDYQNTTLAHHSEIHTKKRSCLLKLFYSMLAQNVESAFIRTHYINVMDDRGK